MCFAIKRRIACLQTPSAKLHIMPNGRGFIDCSYCVYWRSLPRPYSPDTGPGVCDWHRMRIPEFEPGDHRVCRTFKPTIEYRNLITCHVTQDGRVYHLPLTQRMLALGHLAFGYLYRFNCYFPAGRKKAMKLTDRMPYSTPPVTTTPSVISGFTGTTGIVGAFLHYFRR